MAKSKKAQTELFSREMERVTFRIDADTWHSFQDACSRQGSNASVELRRFILEFVRKQDK